MKTTRTLRIRSTFSTYEKIGCASPPRPHAPQRFNLRRRYHVHHQKHLAPIKRVLDKYADIVIKEESNEICDAHAAAGDL